MLAPSAPRMRVWSQCERAPHPSRTAPSRRIGCRSLATRSPSASRRSPEPMFRAYITLEVHGREKLPDGGYVVVSNHASHLDSIVLMHVVGGGRSGASTSPRRATTSSAPRWPRPRAASPRGSACCCATRCGSSRCRCASSARPRSGAPPDSTRSRGSRSSCAAGDVVVFFPEGGRSPDGVMRAVPGRDRRARCAVRRADRADAHRRRVRVLAEGQAVAAAGQRSRYDRWVRRCTAARPRIRGPKRPRLAKRLEAEVRRLGGQPNGKERPMVQHMKWWGWGDEQVTFTHEDKPDLAPFVREKIGIDLDGPRDSVIDFADLTIDEPVVTDAFGAALDEVLRPDQITSDPMERVVHTYGKSLRDLLRVRRGDLGRLPDVIVYPETEDDVVAIMSTALDPRRRRHPVRRGHEHLREPRAAAWRDAHGPLRRHAPDGRGDRDRRRRATRSGAGRRARTAPRGAARRQGLDLRPLPRQLHVLDARRVDRDALVGHAVRQVRRHRRDHHGAARGHAGGRAGHAGGAVEVDRPRRQPDDARQRRSPGDHHRGDGAGAPGAREPQDPRLPLPGLVRRDRRDGRDRRERGVAVGDARRRSRTRRSSRSRRRSRAT